jgi:hypothetical protein
VIGLRRGKGGWLRRLAGEIVPLGVGLVAGQLAGAFLGLWLGIAAGLMTWAFVSGLLVAVRRRPRLRRAYRILLLLHVAFWSARGVIETSDLRGPAAPVAGQVVAWEGATTFRAGVGEATFELPARTTLAGWGQRPRRRRVPAFGGLGLFGRLSLWSMGPPATGEAPRSPLFVRPTGEGEALGARALLLAPDAGGPALAIVRLDLIALDDRLAWDVLEAVGHELRLTPETLLVAATHTHSGPGGVQRPPLATVAGTDHFDPRVYDAVLGACVQALRSASASLRPARLAFPESHDRGADGAPILARNRTLESDEVDDRVLALRVEDAETRAVRALVLHYAVMPVVLRRRHMAFGRDLPGMLEDALSAALPGSPLVLFVNGATGDVSPRSGDPAASVRAFTARVQDDLLAGPSHARIRLRAAAATRDLGTPRTFYAVGDHAAFGDRVLPTAWGADAPSVLANVVALPVNVGIWSLALPQVRFGFTFDGAAGVVLNLETLVGRPTARAGAVLLEADAAAGEPGTGALLLWQGGIPTQGAGRAWRTRFGARGLPAPFVLSLTNGSLGYLVAADEYDGPWRYEALATLYGRESARLVAETLEAAAERVTGD